MRRDLDESDILSAVANDDRKAFAQLFYAFHHELGAFAYRLTKSSVLAEEIVQDTFMKVWEHRHDLPNVKSFRAYLFTISRNHAFNAMRSETKRKFLHDALPAETLLSDEPTGFHHEKEELYGIVEKAVILLPPQQQRVWRMNKEKGLSYQKIADELHLSPQTVKRHVSLAMAAVMRYIKHHTIPLLTLLLFS